MNGLAKLSVFEAAKRIAEGSLTSIELVTACLDRINEREASVGAWAYLNPEQALAEARLRDSELSGGGKPRGPLHGVPVGLKDIIDTTDMPTSYGSPIYEGFRPAAEAACVTRLRAAGAVMMGKTITAEFATYHPGKTANPRNLSHTPGGSSSGSAAAVADDHVPLSLGTQTAGSIIRPASFCGVIGYKPTYNAFSYQGLHPLSISLDTLGVFVRSFADLSPVRQTLAITPPRLNVTGASDKAPRIGFCKTGLWERGDSAMRAALEATAQKLAKAGAEIVEIELSPAFLELVDAQILIFGAEGRRGLNKEWQEHPDLLSAELCEFMEKAAQYTPAQEKAAHQMAAKCRAELAVITKDVDVLLTPSCIGEAPSGLAQTGDPLFNRIWTFLHVPCVTYPIGLGPLGLPLGAQVVGKFDGDDSLIANAWWMREHS
jgi:Asp-tRNA(Asn)/Glu-tRNA(Gln) amidotransferase A subunit family amidase